MSSTTQGIHIRAFSLRLLVPLLDRFLAERGYERTTDDGGELRKLVVRRNGRWSTFTDDHDGEIDAWGEFLSKHTGRSVLTMWTWDGEASVIASRWKNGAAKARLTLLEEAYRGVDGVPRAPAKVLWPWLEADKREDILQDGIRLVESTGGPTGDAELDAMLTGFDEDEDPDTEGDEAEEVLVFVLETTAVRAIGRTVGIERPIVDPWNIQPGERTLLYRRRH